MQPRLLQRLLCMQQRLYMQLQRSTRLGPVELTVRVFSYGVVAVCTVSMSHPERKTRSTWGHTVWVDPPR